MLRARSMRADELLDDDDDEWVGALQRAAALSEEEEWDLRIAQARARVAEIPIAVIARSEEHKARPARAASVGALPLVVSPARGGRLMVVIPPKDDAPRRMARGSGPVVFPEGPGPIGEDEASEMLRDAFARYVNEE